MLFLIAFALGFASGLRTFAPLAIFSGAILLGFLDLGAAGFAWLGSPWAFAVLAGLAVLELLGDKSGRSPPRTSAPALGGRLLAGALIGAAAASTANAELVGAVFGALGAFIGAHAGQAARSRASAMIGGNRIAGLAEDALTVALAAGLVYALTVIA
ncbi:MAG: DUF4126 family protein [Oceanicaulis sp.]